MKRLYFGGAERPLHANELRSPSPVQISALNRFFRRPFARFGAVANVNTSITSFTDGYGAVAMALQGRLAEIASGIDCDSIAVIFEASERTDHLAVRNFSHLQAHCDGQRIPLDFYRMPKAAGWPLLEVADFVAHTAGCQVRHQMRRGGYRLDFQNMFHGQPRRLTSFMTIDRITSDQDAPVAEASSGGSSCAEPSSPD